VVRSTPAAGPFGELRSTPMPVLCCKVYVHRRTTFWRGAWGTTPIPRNDRSPDPQASPSGSPRTRRASAR
jgi:hypothetical protein